MKKTDDILKELEEIDKLVEKVDKITEEIADICNYDENIPLPISAKNIVYQLQVPSDVFYAIKDNPGFSYFKKRAKENCDATISCIEDNKKKYIVVKKPVKRE